MPANNSATIAGKEMEGNWLKLELKVVLKD
jgi:hypothetical protein